MIFLNPLAFECSPYWISIVTLPKVIFEKKNYSNVNLEKFVFDCSSIDLKTLLKSKQEPVLNCQLN